MIHYKAWTPDVTAMALLRCLNGANGMPRVRLYQPSATELSFDERWLLAGLSAVKRRDGDSLAFLLASRIPAHSRRQVGVLFHAFLM